MMSDSQWARILNSVWMGSTQSVLDRPCPSRVSFGWERFDRKSPKSNKNTQNPDISATCSHSPMVWSALDVPWPGVLGSVLGRRSGIARAALDQTAPRSGVPETQYGGRWPAILSKTVDCVGFWCFLYIHVQFLPAEGLEMDSKNQSWIGPAFQESVLVV